MADGMIILPPQVLKAEARGRHDAAVTDEALRIIANLVDADAIASLVMQGQRPRMHFAIGPAVGDAVTAEMAVRRRIRAAEASRAATSSRPGASCPKQLSLPTVCHQWAVADEFGIDLCMAPSDG
jgi:hypothetical protein